MNIGQAAQASGVTAKMIRYYESIGLIGKASRTGSGYRQYTEKDVQALRFIKRSRNLGFSIERIKTLLALWGDRQRRSADVKALAIQYIEELERDIQNLQSIRDQLRHLADCCLGDDRPDCPIIEDLAQPAAAEKKNGPSSATK
ncbi:MAG TPA: Cu(I)-responsive transcriptional regulator [Burkholderiaceae bacterium]|nr:Cu(I)-responsive transcriptional regulator [Burkholderiaceae bacterium]